MKIPRKLKKRFKRMIQMGHDGVWDTNEIHITNLTRNYQYQNRTICFKNISVTGFKLTHR